MTTHDLKTQTPWFNRVAAGEKRAEIRKHDRDFQVGDMVRLIEVTEYGSPRTTWVPEGRDERGRFTAGYSKKHVVTARITHVLPGKQADGIADDYCLLSIQVVQTIDAA
ncbi:MAG: DUF3850 domain-containing protein [Micrococcales bacterium]|nr:DUF3850 domain-containing protein [Micrococcales bacterium]